VQIAEIKASFSSSLAGNDFIDSRLSQDESYGGDRGQQGE
jgi:hypothetical protein